ncbi:hypothetical protein GOV14_02935, partial [Candidatus Pacearchaeota archaeon]|nr:hypothetical protein [Candidatus Pacearchaeota archaeon]
VLPSDRLLKKAGYSSLSNAILKHEKFPAFRKLLGQEKIVKPWGYWDKPENRLKEAREAMENEGWDVLPPGRALCKKGYSSLSNAILNHEGFIAFRELLGQENNMLPRGYWDKLENRLNGAKEAMEKKDWEVLPSEEVLKKEGYSPLSYAISDHEGFPAFREKLNQYLGKKSEKEEIECLLEKYIGRED